MRVTLRLLGMSALIPLNDLSRQARLDARIIGDRVTSALATGQYFNGAETRKLQERLVSLFDGRDFTPMANGTDALIVALEALALSPGSAVAMVPNAGGYGSIAALRAGLVPIYVDVEPVTAQMSLASLQDNLARFPRIGAVIVTHLYGQVGDVEQIANLCKSHDIPLIEDCAQSFGASFNGRPAGTFGDLATLSFYPTKNLGAAGDAGGILTEEPRLSARIRKLAQYGWSDRYVIEVSRGFNSRMDEIQATVLNHNLDKISRWNSERRNIVSRYSAALPNDRMMIGDCSASSFVAHLAVLVTGTRSEDRTALADAGVETSIHYPVLDPDQPAWRNVSPPTDIPVARSLGSSIITLPCFPQMTDDEVTTVCAALSLLGDAQ